MSTHGSLPDFPSYLESLAVDPGVIERWLAGPSWMSFDSELGYVLGNSMPVEGIDGSGTITTVRDNGARRTIMYADRPARINTYGDSFTHCQQVSDGETWQEYLAGHLGEPIANFGVGGFGVYQAYRRMVREEQTGHGADYLILYIWGNDSVRSVTRCFRAFVGPRMDVIYAGREGEMFHGNPWSNIELDLGSGAFVERGNLLGEEDMLGALCDGRWMRENLGDDLALQLCAYSEGLIADLDREETSRLAALLDFELDWSGEPESLRAQAAALLNAYGNAATVHILERAKAFATEQGKELMIVINDGEYLALEQMRNGERRFDQDLLDVLLNDGFKAIDMTAHTFEDQASSGLSWQAYRERQYVNGTGHYSPAGNHFFAYAIKDAIVDWLEPKPVTYQRAQAGDSIDYDAYMKRV